MALFKKVPKPQDPIKFIEDLELELAQLALRKVKSLIQSKTLRDALEITRKDGHTFVGLPHYWAVYYHDGRGPARAGSGEGFGSSVLVWFPNPTDDPRHRGDYPIRASDIRRLSRDEFLQGLEENKRRREAADGGSFEPFMVVSTISPRSGGSVRGFFFFDKAFLGFAIDAAPIIRQRFEKFVDSYTITEIDEARAKF